MMTKLPPVFFERPDVVQVARELIGKILLTRFDGIVTSGRIVETEAYNGVVDRASHAYKGRRTARTETMYSAGGVAYVYLCYGIHHLFNVVTNIKDVPHAVLIRGIEPVEGVEQMLDRMRKLKLDHTVGRGPGNVSRALGISTEHTGNSLQEEISIWDDGFVLKPSDIIASPRIGIDYAGEDATLPYRFYQKGNRHVSGKGNK
ncbi:DNA-3-methyladenine glycosylase [Flavihumibacter solisilvae]|uniref:Putative 3-methyladenine DNA glycosylase n=1 Tax=Flavihumibacter solisilvae TaxID=1349421 RepID=A0A0C1L5A1_9BACT|nr:DNA-3-methyladenine glycosylase [Flavihumibacter solisilvae]KIC95292.1 3-methyladenine DNA glycosylase [Flavihumibacter solisilvae]